jgi:uncharacterized membrane protein
MASENDPTTRETLTLTAYLDGFVLATHEFEINQSYPTINFTLLGNNFENLLFLDEENIPLDYTVSNGEATVSSLGASVIRASYLTQDLTTKTGKFWELSAMVSTNTTVILPEDSTIMSLNNVPERIESTNGQVTLVMPPGMIEISYITEHNQTEETTSTADTEPRWLLIGAVSLFAIPAFALVFIILKRKKTPKVQELTDLKEKPEVDIEKILTREKDLRQEEVQVVRFLAEKNGSALEAELYEKLQLPRTTTWRLLKRLARMEIVDIEKSRRQNTVSIRKKYMKK